MINQKNNLKSALVFLINKFESLLSENIISKDDVENFETEFNDLNNSIDELDSEIDYEIESYEGQIEEIIDDVELEQDNKDNRIIGLNKLIYDMKDLKEELDNFKWNEVLDFSSRVNELLDMCNNSGDYEVIGEHYIDEYLENLLDDCYSDFINNKPCFIEIDMTATIDNMKLDYSSNSITFDDKDYEFYYR